MAPPFRKISLESLSELLDAYPFARSIDTVLAHAAGRETSLVGLWRQEVSQGLAEVSWHLAVEADGSLALGRDWNLPSPGTDAFVIAVLGDAADPAVQERAEAVGNRVLTGLDLPDGALSLEGLEGFDQGVAAIEAIDDETAAEEDVSAEVSDLVREMLRSGVAAGSLESSAESAGVAGLFPEEITTDMLEVLRLHVIDLTRGRLSEGGLFETSEDDVDALFGEHLEQAVAGHGPGNPLRILFWAHGGLVNERGGLLDAYRKILWWRRNGVYPVYFVWETGLLKALGRVITGRSPSEEAGVAGITDLTDRAIEATARTVGGPEVWSDMKGIARIASSAADGGGAHYAAGKLAEFCERHPGEVALYAGAHSAGAIFHASFLPAALEAGAPHFAALHLLAPAIRVDRFLERLAPRLGPGKGIERCTIFTLNKLRELDDNCIGIYRKSLLYLIHFALEDRRETPILGLEISLRGNQRLREMFGLGGPGAGAVGEVVWSKSPATADLRSRSRATSHPGIDDDPATLDSVLRRVLDRDDIPLSFEAAGALTPDDSVPAGAEDDGFLLQDAVERAAEAMLADELEELQPGIAGELLEAVAIPEIAFGPNAKEADVTAFSRQVLTDILSAAGLARALVSSTSRQPADQARVMFVNLEQQGVAAQRKLYKEPGRKVIQVYVNAKAAGKSPAAIRALMEAEIRRLGPTTVSRHAADPKVLNVFDVAPSSILNRTAFEAAVRAETRVAKFLVPPTDPGYHLEIPQPQVG